MKRNVADLRLSGTLLRDFLKLPAGAYITDIRHGDGLDTFFLRVEHHALPEVAEGGLVPEGHIVVTQSYATEFYPDNGDPMALTDA